MGRTSTTMDTTAARHAYRRASPATDAEFEGDWSIEFLGDRRWLTILGRAQRVLGIANLHGLRFEGDLVWHLVGSSRSLTAVKPLHRATAFSQVDGEPTTIMASGPDNGPLWQLVRSEVRTLGPDRLIGVDLVGWSRLVVPMPFLLHRDAE